MMSPDLVNNITDRIAKAMGMTPEEFTTYQKNHMDGVNKRLAEQMASLKMTQEVLLKRCTL